jgi:YidC/Oxa1 family membrane protein insertase
VQGGNVLALWGQLVAGMTWLLEFFYGWTKTMGIPNYGIAIILLTITVKMVLFPLTIKQMRSMKMTQQLQPKIKEIQEKHKDPQKAQVAIMEMYKEYGASPLAGCLPLILQMPILIGLYQTLVKFPFPENGSFLWLSSLKYPDPWYLIPILAGVTTFLSQWLTTNMQDQTQRTMLYVMPVFIGWITVNFPSGLGLYWVISNVVGAIQQYFINRMPTGIPLKEEAKEEPVKDEGNRKKRKNS